MTEQEMLCRAAEESLGERYDSYIASLDTDTEPELSANYQQKMDKLINRRRKSYFALISTAGRRAACAAAAVIILIGAPLTAGAVIKRAYDFKIEETDSARELTVSRTDSAYPKIIKDEYTIPELEESWELLSEHFSYPEGESIMREYTREGELFILGQFVIDHYVVELDENFYDFETLTDGEDREYIVPVPKDSAPDEKGTLLVWNNGEYVFLVNSTLPKNEVLKLCRELKIKEK